METAQTLDEAAMDSGSSDATGLAAYSRFRGVQFVISVSKDDPTNIDHWATENPEEIAGWIHHTSRALRVLGAVEAGFPSPAEEELGDTIDLDEFLIKNKEATYMLKVTGDSMKDAGIHPCLNALMSEAR